MGVDFKDFRERVIDYRLRNGLTQKEMAKLCGVTRVTIGKIESETYHRPNFVTMFKIESVIKKGEE